MPREVESGERVGEYTIVEKVNSGGMASAYTAKDRSGNDVFLKQYHSPTVRSSWYPGYVAYQEAMKDRIETTSFRNFSYRMIEFFEFNAKPRCYFQVMEFVDSSQSLESRLQHSTDGSKPLDWPTRLTMAKVMMGAIKMLHDAKIVHSDLKPANVILIDNPSSRMGYTLKVIDFDFSLLADKSAPWHDDPDQGYFGTPGYMSPEHLSGQVPRMESDVFTCGLMLYQLLSSTGHPYLDGEAYDVDALAHRADAPKLLGKMDAGNDGELIELMHQSLSPDTSRRPSAERLHQELIRNSGAPTPRTPPPVPAIPSRPAPPAPPAPASSTSTRLVLTSESGATNSFGVSSNLGARVARAFGADAQFFSEPQMELVKDGNDWFVVPAETATNQTMLNGKAIASRTKLSAGDTIAVGNESKGIIKLPLTVSMQS